MVEENSDTMNLDLNLSPGPEARSEAISRDTLNLEDWGEDSISRIRETVRLRSRRWRRQVETPPPNRVIWEQLIDNSANGTTLQAGQGSTIAPEGQTDELPKMCENNNGILEDEVSEKKDDVEKDTGNDGSFFDCNICLDLAKDPVVTCCGHLFCWPCLYRWLHVHSEAKECPVCKGEVTLKNVTPIYGRGNVPREPDDDLSLRIPLRPHARRVESLRQTIQRTAFNYPIDEMIRRLGSRFDLARDLTPPREGTSARETADRTNSLINRILTSRGIRREQNSVSTDVDDVDSGHSGLNNEEGEARGNHSHYRSLRRQYHQHRAASLSPFSSALGPERPVEAYFRSHHIGRNQEQPSPPVDDRDSFSSIAAVINSESQMDTAVEIDSMVSLSTSSSRRRSDNSRISDVDSGDSPAPRRRRLN